MHHTPFILGLTQEIHHAGKLTTEELTQAIGQNTGNLSFYYAIDQLFGGNLILLPLEY